MVALFNYRRTIVGSLILISAQGAWAQVVVSDLEAHTFVDHWSEGGSSGNFNLPYRLFKPTGFAGPAGSLPLVIYLHGAGERGTDNLSQLSTWSQPLGFVQSTVQAAFPSFFVAPQGPTILDPLDPRYISPGAVGRPDPEFWVNNYVTDPDEYRLSNVPASRSLLAAFDLVDSLKTQFPSIDPNRVYITGWSSGADAVWYAMLTRPNLFAAGVPIAGLGDPTAVAAADLEYRGIWAWHGAADTSVPLSATQKMVDAIVGAGGTLGSTNSSLLRQSTVPGADHYSTMATAFSQANLTTDSTYSWLFNQSFATQAGGTSAPEPGTLGLLTLGALPLLRRRRHTKG